MATKSKAIGPSPIHPTAAYTRRQLLALLPKIGYEGITAEVRAGRLRRSSRLGCDWFFGQWIIDWLAAGEVRPSAIALGRLAPLPVPNLE